MKSVKTIQLSLWVLFLAYYCLDKFFAGYQGYSHAYLIQVGIIVLLTAVIPFYLSRWLATFSALKVPATLLLPSALAMAGYAGFFVVFIAPNFPDMSMMGVVVRGLIPGIAISLILGVPEVFTRFGMGLVSQR